MRTIMRSGAGRRRRAIGLFVVLATVTVAACGDDDGSAGGGDSSNGEVAQAAENCPGDPLRFTTIAAQSGAMATGGDELSVAADVAVRDVNRECSLGRPVEVVVCDDQSDPNGSTECGRTAAEDGSLALIDAVGLFDTGAEASGLPSIYTLGTGTFDHTNPQSYPFADIIAQVLGSVTTAQAAGADSFLLVANESPATVFVLEQGQALADELGIEYDTLLIPSDTTDFAPIAAQIVAADPDALGFGVSQAEPFVGALLAEGWDFQEHYTSSTSTLFPPSVLESLGADGEGLYMISSVVPPTVTDNPEIDRMREAFDAAGADFGEASTGTVTMWAAVHSLVDALSALSPDEIADLDSATLVDAVKAQGPVERPEVAPFDLSGPAFPDNPALSELRVFSRSVMPTRVENGEMVPVAGFIDVETPFEIEG